MRPNAFGSRTLGQLRLPLAGSSRPGYPSAGVFAAQVARLPDAVAVRFEGRSLSYARTRQAATRLAHHLVGAAPGRRYIGAAVARSARAIVAILAVLKSGAALSADGPATPDARIAFMLAPTPPDRGADHAERWWNGWPIPVYR